MQDIDHPRNDDPRLVIFDLGDGASLDIRTTEDNGLAVVTKDASGPLECQRLTFDDHIRLGPGGVGIPIYTEAGEYHVCFEGHPLRGLDVMLRKDGAVCACQKFLYGDPKAQALGLALIKSAVHAAESANLLDAATVEAYRRIFPTKH